MHTVRPPLTADEQLEIVDQKIHAYERQQYDMELEARIASKVKNPEIAAQAIKTLKQLEEVLSELAVIRQEITADPAQSA